MPRPDAQVAEGSADADEADLATDRIFTAPTLVVEVLSPSTQAYDRSQKFALYRRIPALMEYILVDPDTRRVEAFRRNADDQWVLHDMSDGDVLEAASVGARIALADVFAGVFAIPQPSLASNPSSLSRNCFQPAWAPPNACF